MLQAAESGAASSAEGGAQAATSGSVVRSILGEIGDEDSKARAGELGSDEFGGGGDRGFLGGGSGGNRWSRQETLPLLKTRSDMDVVFRDSSLKGLLKRISWEYINEEGVGSNYQRLKREVNTKVLKVPSIKFLKLKLKSKPNARL